MSNYFDYLSWRGDLSLENDPLNEIDITSFALLVYLDFNDIVNEDEELTMAQAVERFILLGKKVVVAFCFSNTLYYYPAYTFI